MTVPRTRPLVLALSLAAVLSACGRDGEAVDAGPAPATAAAPAQVVLEDVIETTPTHVVGISYDPRIQPGPGLARALAAYAEEARRELAQALAELGNDAPRVPYELSLSFEQTVGTPRLKAVAADGSLYTGGAHGQPLVERFVWLVEEDRRLTNEALVPAADSRRAIAAYVERQLLDQVQARLQDDRLEPALQQEILDNARGMIAEGTEPSPGNFRQFQPVVDGQGRITAIRYVFPPYQVGPYADGVQSVDVPAEVIRPHVAAEYAPLFD